MYENKRWIDTKNNIWVTRSFLIHVRANEFTPKEVFIRPGPWRFYTWRFFLPGLQSFICEVPVYTSINQSNPLSPINIWYTSRLTQWNLFKLNISCTQVLFRQVISLHRLRNWYDMALIEAVKCKFVTNNLHKSITNCLKLFWWEKFLTRHILLYEILRSKYSTGTCSLVNTGVQFTLCFAFTSLSLL